MASLCERGERDDARSNLHFQSMTPTRKTVAKGSAWATLFGLLLTTGILYLHSISPPSQEVACRFNMSTGLMAAIDDTETIHNNFKQCLFDAAAEPTLKITQLTAILDHGTSSDASFEVYFEANLYEQWRQEKLDAHVQHLFLSHTKSFCVYPFAVLQGKCKFK
jgi:hypothetical protein